MSGTLADHLRSRLSLSSGTVIRVSAPVIVGVEASDGARDALALGKALANALDAEAIPVHVSALDVLTARVGGAPPREGIELMDELATRDLEAVQTLVSEAGGPAVQHVEASSAPAGLHELIEQRAAQLVVLGSSQQGRLGKIMPGTTGHRLLSGSPVPIAVAPVGYRDEASELRRIGCGVADAAQDSAVVQWAADLARRLDAALELIAAHATVAFDHLPTGTFGPTSVRQDLHADLARDLEQAQAEIDGVSAVESRVVDGDPVAVLVAESEALDLLVLGSRGYGPVRAVLLGSVSTGVVRAGSCPVVVMPRSEN